MRFANIDSVSPATLPDHLPLRLELRTSAISIGLRMAVLLPVTVGLLYPFLLLAQGVAANAEVRTLIASKPGSLTQLALGLAFWAVLFAWPLKRLVQGLTRRRVIEIADGMVNIADESLLGTRRWSEPVANYAGVIHHVRASLSGLRHELILAHPDHRRSILLTMADRIGQAEIDRVAHLMGQPEVPSKIIYDLGQRLARRARPATEVPLADAA